MRYKIPGREDLLIENLVLDYNGTLAYSGKLIEGVEELLNSIKDINVYIVTADTYGSVREECKNIDCELLTFPKENAGLEKEKIVENLGGARSICIGNGFNDIAMFKKSALSIAVIGGEGACGSILNHSDIVVTSIIDALNIVKDENKLRATLRS